MKIVILILAVLLQGCASLTALQSGGAQTPATSNKPDRLQAGTTVTPLSNSYPSVVVTPGGGHAVVMPPCGNLSVVVNPDGTHSTAVINGTTATIVTP